MSGLTRDRTAEPVSRDQILRGAQTSTYGKMFFPFQLTTKQDEQTYRLMPILLNATSMLLIV